MCDMDYSRRNQEPASAIDKQAAEKLRREWANFLTYDGTAQEPTE